MAKQELTSKELQLLSAELEKEKKSTTVSWLLLLFLGGFGAHRFYLGHIGLGIAMIIVWLISIPLAFVPIAIWLIVDIVLLTSAIKEENNKIEKGIIQDIMLMRKTKMDD